MPRIQKKRGFMRTRPNRYDQSSSLSKASTLFIRPKKPHTNVYLLRALFVGFESWQEGLRLATVLHDNPPSEEDQKTNHHHYFSKSTAISLYCSTFGAPRPGGKEILSVLLPFVLQYMSHSYRNMPPICVAMLLGKSWWLGPPGCSPLESVIAGLHGDWLLMCGFDHWCRIPLLRRVGRQWTISSCSCFGGRCSAHGSRPDSAPTCLVTCCSRMNLPQKLDTHHATHVRARPPIKEHHLVIHQYILVDVSDIFSFFCSGRGNGGVRGVGKGGGVDSYQKSQEGGGDFSRRGAEGPGGCAANWGIWGGGAKYFFSGPKCPPRHIHVM